MPQRSGQRCCENTEPDISQEQESAGPSVHEPSQDDFIALHSSKGDTNGMDENHTDFDDTEDMLLTTVSIMMMRF